MSKTIELRPPYLLFIGDVAEPTFAKTAFGLVQWRRELVAGQMRLPGNALDLGVPDMDVAAAVRAGVGSLVIGVAPVGGTVGPGWLETLCRAAQAGLDIVSGLHVPLASFPGLAEAAARWGTRLVDVRVPPPGIPVGTGRRRSGRRVLTVGTDCAVGKKYTALALARALAERGVAADFRASGQTGIMIAGAGIPIDAVVSDFVSGAAEALSPAAAADHWDVIEGQGSLFHPSYAAVSLGLLHGSQPDAIVLCHAAGRERIESAPDFPVPPLPDCIEANLRAARLVNPAVACIGISVNASALPAAERAAFKARIAAETGLPCIDPLADGCGALADALLARCGGSA